MIGFASAGGPTIPCSSWIWHSMALPSSRLHAASHVHEIVNLEEMMSPPHANDTQSPRIDPDDPRYLAVIEKRFNKRFIARPDYVRLAHSTDQVISIVEDAVREGR